MASSFAVFLDCSGNLAINSADDITTLNQCTTFTGNVSLAAKGLEAITLNGIKAITGTITIANSDAIVSISSTTLEAISTLTLSNLPQLTTLTLPALTNISKLDFTGLSSLRGCEIASGSLKQDIKEISIISTAMEKMDWIKWPIATALTIAANNKLTDFTLPYDRINSGSSYQFSINHALTNLDFSNLSGIYGSLAINGNPDPSLNFDNLETIDGYVRISGALKNITMPKLQTINGALRAESTVDILAFCNWLSIQNRLYGHYDCTANNTSVYTSTVSKSPSSTAVSSPAAGTAAMEGADTADGKKTDLSSGAIVGIAIAMVVLISAVLTLSALLFMRRRSRNRAQQAAAAAAADVSNVSDEKKIHSTSTLGKKLPPTFSHHIHYAMKVFVLVIALMSFFFSVTLAGSGGRDLPTCKEESLKCGGANDGASRVTDPVPICTRVKGLTEDAGDVTTGFDISGEVVAADVKKNGAAAPSAHPDNKECEWQGKQCDLHCNQKTCHANLTTGDWRQAIVSCGHFCKWPCY
ncbi:uncharacterized protein M421DRAFT_2498 [Didymella exigua CBS 183.55]|uniref:Receptor L-domain domain-containing protein n=1 Tax=Didymella exigua CBS 183.55 TaxID=1150837 RepID=A0A6A5RWF1_9PLEO|nr:uncharacterized protein M421DRAFT_2498 [Didymella exigua CBS 183.55]KAF1931879.1 hypothetical protein M421DRAFT_2498 [Didymella exigua CBS 183.55]